MLYRIIAASLILIPVFCWPGWGEGIRAPKEAVSIISLMAIVIVSLTTYHLKPFRNKWLLILMGWCFFTVLIGINVPVYLEKIILQMPPMMIAAKSLFYITLSVMSIVFLSSIPLDLNKISRVINFTVMGLCAYGLLQAVGLDEFFRVAGSTTGWVAKSIWDSVGSEAGSFSHRIVSTLGNPAILSTFLAICVPFSLYRLKDEGKFSLILALIIIGMTQSFTGILCTAVSSIVYFAFTNRKIARIIIVSIIVIGAISYKAIPTFLNPTGRFEVVKQSWKILDKKPLTGLGLGSFEHLVGDNPDIVARLKNQNWKEAHNEYWQGWFEIGLIGLMLLCMAIGSTLRRFLKKITLESVVLMSSFVAILVAGAGYFVLRVGPIAFYIIVIYGLLENKIGETA